ncbi:MULTISPECIES: hypothetical protein [Roseobacteraceae]|uniref:Uncharacterized protein n=1 Tax=Pseudosulfitobacter pseudonitzschiae TaxID=1402135 RepID=A0A221JYS7_9RHOB|nr:MULTISPECIES: hypothetical protein [Roseobacteraceae]ASM71889.1 hypothetical protein SULPSESMR1_01063 [Pseudosulfitobacter pseudonitzschiae]
MADTLPMHTDVPATAHALGVQTQRPDFAEVGVCVNAAIRDTGMTLTEIADQPQGHVLFSHPRVHLSIVTHRRKLPRTTITGALASPFAKARTPDYDRLFDGHTRYITLDVGHGPAPDDLTNAPLPLVLRLQVLKAALDALIDTVPLTLVHWLQSDMVFVPSEMEIWKDRDLPFALVIQPLPLPAPPDLDGASRLGMVAACSEHLLGKTLYLDPMPRDQATGFRQLVSILNEHHEGRIRLEHGDSLELTDGTVLYVRHEKPTSADRPGRIHVGPTPPQERVALATDAAGFGDRVARLKGIAHRPDKMIIDIQDKVDAEARPRKSRAAQLAFSLLVRGVVLPALLLVLYYQFFAAHAPAKVTGVLPSAEVVHQSALSGGTYPEQSSVQGTAQP